MKTFLFIGITLTLLILDWAALHDIIKGEPNLYGEYGMVFLSITILALILTVGLGDKSFRRTIDEK